MLFKDFSEFKDFCSTIAVNLHTMVGLHEYSNYGWAQAAFMTDNFGGVYAIFHYNMETNEITYNYATPTAIKMVNKNMIEDTVRLQLYYILEKRDLNEVADFINSQY